MRRLMMVVVVAWGCGEPPSNSCPEEMWDEAHARNLDVSTWPEGKCYVCARGCPDDDDAGVLESGWWWVSTVGKRTHGEAPECVIEWKRQHASNTACE